MRVVAGVAWIALLTAAIGCGGARDNRIVRITVAWDENPVTVAVEQPVANGFQAPLTSVLPLVPEELLAGAPQDPVCRTRQTVTIQFASGRSVRYGPCGPLAESIEELYRAITVQSQWAPRLVGHTTIVGGLPSERRALAKLLRSFAPTPIRRIEFTTPRRRVGENEVAWKIIAGPSPLGKWESELLVRLYRGEASRLHLRRVAWMDSAEGGGPVNANGIGPPVGSLQDVRRVLEAAEARVVEVRRIRGAMELTIRADHPASFLKNDGERFLRALRRPERASVYFALQDATGVVVYGAGWVPGMGMSFGSAELRACGPVRSLGTPFGHESKPCPA
jgi:hypothetical protein